MAEQFNRKPVFMRKSTKKTIRFSDDDLMKLGKMSLYYGCSEPEVVRIAVDRLYDEVNIKEKKHA